MHTKDKTYSTFLSTKALLKELPEQFIQTHHSYVFNVNYFYKFENNDITLAIDNTRFFIIPISRKLRRVFRRTSFPS
ncbi:LytTR family DNA-binding domain-containing protein [Streptococcus equi]|uniref:LytTR family DNA-binding domain-containing protein n=1 Tax=Streptococcus equi TaxID=1336 RepID=UPI001E48658E